MKNFDFLPPLGNYFYGGFHQDTRVKDFLVGNCEKSALIEEKNMRKGIWLMLFVGVAMVGCKKEGDCVVQGDCWKGHGKKTHCDHGVCVDPNAPETDATREDGSTDASNPSDGETPDAVTTPDLGPVPDASLPPVDAAISSCNAGVEEFTVSDLSPGRLHPSVSIGPSSGTICVVPPASGPVCYTGTLVTDIENRVTRVMAPEAMVWFDYGDKGVDHVEVQDNGPVTNLGVRVIYEVTGLEGLSPTYSDSSEPDIVSGDLSNIVKDDNGAVTQASFSTAPGSISISYQDCP